MINATSTPPPCIVDIEQSSISDFLMAMYTLAFIFGMTFNLLTLGPIIQQVRSRNVLGVFLLNLLLSDLIFILTIPLWINYYYYDHQWKLGAISCSVAGFFYYSNMYISIYLLCCISVDRCLAVTSPLRSKAYRSARYSWLLCAAVFVLVVLAHVFILLKDNLSDPHDNDGKDRCYETYPMTASVAMFNLIRVGIGFAFPLLVLAVSYYGVLGAVGKSHGLNPQGKRKVRLLSYGVIGIFCVCFAPYHVLLLLRSLLFYFPEQYCQFENAMHFPFSITLALSSFNCVVDPVLYVLVSNGVKEDFRLCWRGGRGRGGGRGGQGSGGIFLTNSHTHRHDANLI